MKSNKARRAAWRSAMPLATAMAWVHWCLWAHGGNVVDKDDKVIINSPETEKALELRQGALRQV